ncbi:MULTISPECIES: Flp family type IVb pilin [unclassified Achromobacter]|uniref:Flp family type IVb pilin n=1 Tax=unclassified Achromobacter TaxID=2626865 RepID=UPI0009E75D91|nr:MULTISPECIES: Flp family type IVb pilin [unclassified Achromobacter]
MKGRFVQFWKDEDGITALEYGMIAGLIAVALVVAIGYLTDGLESLFTTIKTKLESFEP